MAAARPVLSTDSKVTSGLYPIYYGVKEVNKVTRTEEGIFGSSTTEVESTTKKTKILGMTLFSDRPVITRRQTCNPCTIL